MVRRCIGAKGLLGRVEKARSSRVESGVERFNAIAEIAKLADHASGVGSFGLGANGGAVFLVADAVVQDLPHQPAEAVRNGPDSLLIGQAGFEAAKDDLKNTSFDFHCGMGRLVEDAPESAVAVGRTVTFGNFRALLLSGAYAYPGAEVFG